MSPSFNNVGIVVPVRATGLNGQKRSPFGGLRVARRRLARRLFGFRVVPRSATPAEPTLSGSKPRHTAQSARRPTARATTPRDKLFAVAVLFG